MIISHKKKFGFFRVPKTGSSTAELMLRLCGAFDLDDIMTVNCGLPSTLSQDIMDKIEDRARNILLKYYKKEGELFDEEYFEMRVKASLVAFSAHLTPKDMIKLGLMTKEQLQEYKIVAFVRDPLDRHLSAYRYMMPGIHVSPDMFHDAVRSEIKLMNKEMVLTRPLTDYFYVDGELITEPLFFDDFDNEIRRAISMVNGYTFNEIPLINPSRSGVDKSAFYKNEEVNDILCQHLADDIEFYQSMLELRP